MGPSSAVHFNCKGLVGTGGKNVSQNSSQNCAWGQFVGDGWGLRVGGEHFAFGPLYKMAPRTWTRSGPPVSSLMCPVMCLLNSRKESEGSERINSRPIWNSHEAVHTHPPALSPLLFSALWRLPEYLIEPAFPTPTSLLQRRVVPLAEETRLINKHQEIASGF